MSPSTTSSSPLPPLRLAVLECDTLPKYGGYGTLFDDLLRKGAGEARDKDGVSVPEPDVREYNVVDEEVYPSLEEVDVVLISGSHYNSFDNDIWILKLVDFTKKVLEQKRVRLIGVCFGHQIVGRAMGQEVGRSEGGWEISVTPMVLTERGREVFGVRELALHQMHRDAVFTCPPEVELLGHSPSCQVQGMYEKKRLITVQGHPEFDGVIVADLLDKWHERGVFDDDTYKEAMGRVGKHHDGVAVAAAFIRFALEQ